MNTQREFLQISDGQAVSIVLKYNTGLLRNGQFGKYFVYTVTHEGKEKLLKVTERLEKQFRKHNVQGGQEITLRKDLVNPKEGEPYSVVNLVAQEDQPAGTSPLVEPEELAHESLAKITESADELRLLNTALTDARTICKNSNEPSIIPEVTLAVGLFLARTIRNTMSTRGTNQRKRFTRRTRKPDNAEDQQPVTANDQKDDLPF